MDHSSIRSIAAFLCSGLALCSPPAGDREVAGLQVPAVVYFRHTGLQLNGAGLRTEMLFIKVYVAALYLQNPTPDAREAIASDQIKQMMIVMLRDAGRDTLVRDVRDGINRNCRERLPALRARLGRLEQALPAVSEGDVLSFTYVPGQGTVVSANGREVTIEGKDFADALFSAWLGRHPVSSRLKRQLLSTYYRRLFPPFAPA